MRRDFVANVSHEIRTPLTVLAGFVETMSSLPLTEVERQRVMVLMEQQTARMQALVGDLLALAKLEGSPRPPTDEWTGVRSLMRHVMSDATVLSDGKHRLSVDGGDNAEIAGSHGELLSAVANLVNNAVRYTPQGGEVSLHWRWREDGGGVFDVIDTGPGIAPEHLPRVTERFYRVDSSRSRDTGGTGLGLSIVKHVAQRHGGDIEVHSELGKGSSFRLSLPAVRVRKARVAASEAAAEAVQSG
jgi:two-component system phosphate regulon sensor histidine kinase PhoR